MPVKTIEWHHNKVRLIDQTLLPVKLKYLEIETVEALAEAIKSLRVRGAPAIGIAAAFGVILAVQNSSTSAKQTFFAELDKTIHFLQQTRPTAINLFWALQRMKEVAQSNHPKSITELKAFLLKEAQDIYEEDRKICRTLGQHGDKLIPPSAIVMTHCNTGALATADFGTALGVLFKAHSAGKKLKVFVDETRPLLQGARLNMWELIREGIPSTLICDNAAAFVMQRKKVDLCIVGADRITRNGDTANKIGTYSLAVNAYQHGIPFYVAAPISTIDFTKDSGKEIPIEERPGDEITNGFGRRTAPEGCSVYSPAFDVTPHHLITAIITEAGVIKPPYDINLTKLLL